MKRRDFLKALFISTSLLVLGRLSVNEFSNYQHAQGALTPFGSWYVVQISGTPEIPKNYVLTVDGEVENPLQLTYQDILDMPSVQVKDTIQCVSDPYFLRANVVWTGVPLKYIIEMVKPSQNTIKVVGYGADGYTADLPISKAMEPDVILAYLADGNPLPIQHGYPVRLAVPGWWGYSYPKWLVRLHFTSRNVLGYWESRGYPDYAKK
ncbi:molybdopterin-dependent oxidoreductase [Metallosphaera hakonensis]|uniref:Oxidoreductase n=1 Tax=Metallosphaera hakonensis JCM 8857 = DSM 7519 TaxID=1293036 RepID=A0A2U9IX62_9CREN|nr:molybdopterin-dependent oxidoreductase [Metallosphaera hakonensis]AWS00476.1 molybdopterin-dependent oxidoreductase [Metallosphaera hakonensis JCM 8857 = DSM 7519]